MNNFERELVNTPKYSLNYGCSQKSLKSIAQKVFENASIKCSYLKGQKKENNLCRQLRHLTREDQTSTNF